MWLSLRKNKPKVSSALLECFDDRINFALSDMALAAFVLDPNSDKTLLKSSDWGTINEFFMKHLKNQGIDHLIDFKEKKGVFVEFFKRKMKAIAFWKMVKPQCEELANLAVKILSVPSSNSQIERIFYNWSTIHTKLRNRLTSENSKKLIHIYYSLRTRIEKPKAINEPAPSNDIVSHEVESNNEPHESSDDESDDDGFSLDDAGDGDEDEDDFDKELFQVAQLRHPNPN